MRALTTDDCPAEIAALIEQCLEDEPWKRPSAKQVFDVIKVSRSGGDACCAPPLAADRQDSRSVLPSGSDTGECVDGWCIDGVGM